LGGKIAIGGVGGLMAAQAVRNAIKSPVSAAIGVAPAIGGFIAAKAIIKGVKKRRARKEAERLIAKQEQQAVAEQTHSQMFGKEREKRIAEEYRRSREQ
jgi:Na+/alanine symporter